MDEPSATADVSIVNPQGMHLRPADLFARTAGRFQSKVCVSFAGQQADGRGVVDLLMLAARQGSQLTITATGDDCEAALATLVDLVNRGFDEMEGAKETE
jgi:phosphotransferase system HPr (HPr) family protein